MKTGLESLDTGAPSITYSGNEGPKSPQEIEEQMMAGMMEDIAKDFEREFGYDMSLANPEVITEYIKEWKSRQDDTSRGPVLPNDLQGGITQLVKKNQDGSRPGYRGDAAYRSASEQSKSIGQGNVGSVESFGDSKSKDPSEGIAGVERNTGLEKQRQKNIDMVDEFKNKPYEPPKFIPSAIATVALKTFPNFFANMDKKRRERFLASNIDWANIKDEDDLLAAYKSFNTVDTTNEGGGGGDGPQQIIPIQTAMLPETSEDLGTEFVANFTRNQLTDADKERISNIGGKSTFLADGGRANYAGGGIADLRQGYFLGKLVKKATRGIKKLFKSPIAKAALLGFAGFGIPGGSGLTGGFFNSAMGKKLGIKLLMDKGAKDFTMANADPFKIGILGASALTGLLAKQDEEEEVSLDQYLRSANRGPSLDPAGIRAQIAANKGNINPIDYAFLNPSYYQQVADGGRIGLMNGGIGKLRGALSKEMFGYNEDDEDEIKKLAMGGSAGMPPITGMSEGVDSMSFPDDESTGMAQATPTMPNQMPMRPPMMDPRMQQQMMMQQRMNPMMARGMMPRMMAQEGGRIGYQDGGNGDRNPIYQDVSRFLYGKDVQDLTDDEYVRLIKFTRENNAQGGRAGRVAVQEGGLMDMGGMEKDYRNEGGFVAIGGQERADDVPARLSKNEFVFTADAVRNAGGGDIDKGAEIMENMMENLEAGGKVSKASQGLSGAREMFATQQRLGEVL